MVTHCRGDPAGRPYKTSQILYFPKNYETIDDYMSIINIESDFLNKITGKIQLINDGVNRYKISTPFLFDDGDHLVIILKKEGNNWVLTDEAHTFMRLSYDIDSDELEREPIQNTITNILSSSGVVNDNGELKLFININDYADALYSFIQVLLRISNVLCYAPEIILNYGHTD